MLYRQNIGIVPTLAGYALGPVIQDDVVAVHALQLPRCVSEHAVPHTQVQLEEAGGLGVAQPAGRGFGGVEALG